MADVDQVETEEVEEQPALAEVEQPTEEQPAVETDEVVVLIGEEESPPSDEQTAPEWVRELRKANREKDREIRELREQVKATQQPQKQAVGAKPTLEGCDYDGEKFAEALEAWHERKRAADVEEQKRRDAQEAQQKEWNAKLETYGKLKSELKVSDYEDAEQSVQSTLSQTQLAMIVDGADNPAVLVYALGKNPKKAKELAALNNPVKFAFAVAKLETQLKVQPRKSAPPPESVVRGSGAPFQGKDKELDKLYEEAARTGDMTKVREFKRANRERH